MSVTGEQIVNKAHAYIGQHEDPMGSNRGRFVEACQRATFLAGTGWPWCAAFECKVCADCHVPLAYNGASAHGQADHHKPWVPITHARAGMMVDFNIGSGHTGILVSMNHESGTLSSIDGNWGDKVSLVTHRISEVRAVWKVPGVSYGAKPTPPAEKHRLPAFEVVTSQSGHKKIVFRSKTKKGLIKWLGTHNLAKLFPNGITIKRGKK